MLCLAQKYLNSFFVRKQVKLLFYQTLESDSLKELPNIPKNEKVLCFAFCIFSCGSNRNEQTIQDEDYSHQNVICNPDLLHLF